MVNLIRFNDGYEMLSTKDRIRIYRSEESLNRSSIQPDYISNFFEFIKHKLECSNQLYRRDFNSDFYIIEGFILGIESYCISVTKNRFKSYDYYVKVGKEFKLDIFRKLDEF